MFQGRGYTLVESIVVVAMLAILVSVAAPAFARLAQQNRLTSEVNLLLAHLQFARNRAVTHARAIVVCPSQDGIRCLNDPLAWQQGWLVFADINPLTPPQLDAEDSLLASHIRTTDRLGIDANLAYVRYNTLGHANNGSITFCDHSSHAKARALIISIVGRVRISDRSASGEDLACIPT